MAGRKDEARITTAPFCWIATTSSCGEDHVLDEEEIKLGSMTAMANQKTEVELAKKLEMDDHVESLTVTNGS